MLLGHMNSLSRKLSILRAMLLSVCLPPSSAIWSFKLMETADKSKVDVEKS